MKIDQPIIQSRLDTDFYKLTMGRFVWENYRDVPVRYAFKNRTTKVRLAEHIDIGRLREELDHAMSLQFTNEELRYIAGISAEGKRLFPDAYVEFLRTSKLPGYELRVRDGQLEMEFAGPWSEAIWWELVALPIVTELYSESLGNREHAFAIGRERLREKIAILRAHSEVIFVEFGTRRRDSRRWQRYIVQELAQLLPNTQFLGTSNVKHAMDFGLEPKGTMAHETVMIISGLLSDTDEGLRVAQQYVFDQWWMMYGSALSIALIDTIGSPFSFATMPERMARDWKGLRQDSGEPAMFFIKAMEFYRRHGVDPKEKSIMFSDGLDLAAMKKITELCKGRTKAVFGWGTNLTNDCGNKSLSLVIKPTEVRGRGVVKLSDNLAKATGKPEDIERYKKVFGYSNTISEECRY